MLTALALLLGAAGILLVWAGVTGRSVVETLQVALVPGGGR